MLHFRPLELADFPAKHFSTEFCLHDGSLFIKQMYGEPTFMAPVGGDFHQGIEAILAYCRAVGCRAVFSVITRDELDAIQAKYRALWVKEMTGWSDYLYESQDLIELAGKRYHGQRNHISQFNRLCPNCLFAPLTDMAAARKFFDRLYAKNPPTDDLAKVECGFIYEILDHYDTYGQVGGVLTVNREIVSVSIGEIVGDTLFVHIEKADTTYTGVYPKTVNLFARAYAGNTRYINREEDMGIAGLRQSKLSYHPVAQLEKFMVELSL